MTLFFAGIAFIVFQRMVELFVAKRNTRVLLQKGAIEFGADHYWILVALHVLFFLSLIVEYWVRRPEVPTFWPICFVVFVLAQAGRVWVMRAMQGRWTTRILVLPGERLVSGGPFKFVSHPNYLIVTIEILFFPMIFGLYFTAVVFSLSNAYALLTVRIPQERIALRQAVRSNGERA